MANTTLTQTGAQVQAILDKADKLPSSLGTAGQVLTMNAGATAPQWETPSNTDEVAADAIAKAGEYMPNGIYDQGDLCIYEGRLYKANTAISGEGAFNSYHWDGTSVEEELETKQDKLVSGTSIKTVNGSSLLGSGNLAIESVKTGTEGSATSVALKFWQGTQQQYDAIVTKDANTLYIVKGS